MIRRTKYNFLCQTLAVFFLCSSQTESSSTSADLRRLCTYSYVPELNGITPKEFPVRLGQRVYSGRVDLSNENDIRFFDGLGVKVGKFKKDEHINSPVQFIDCGGGYIHIIGILMTESADYTDLDYDIWFKRSIGSNVNLSINSILYKDENKSVIWKIINKSSHEYFDDIQIYASLCYKKRQERNCKFSITQTIFARTLR